MVVAVIERGGQKYPVTLLMGEDRRAVFSTAYKNAWIVEYSVAEVVRHMYKIDGEYDLYYWGA